MKFLTHALLLSTALITSAQADSLGLTPETHIRLSCKQGLCWHGLLSDVRYKELNRKALVSVKTANVRVAETKCKGVSEDDRDVREQPCYRDRPNNFDAPYQVTAVCSRTQPTVIQKSPWLHSVDVLNFRESRLDQDWSYTLYAQICHGTIVSKNQIERFVDFYRYKSESSRITAKTEADAAVMFSSTTKPPYIGKWYIDGDKNVCRQKVGQNDSLHEYKFNRVEKYEGSCKVSTINIVRPNVVELSVVCMSEGEENHSTERLTISGDVMNVESISLAGNFKHQRQRCR